MTEHDDSIVRPTVRAIVDDASTIPLADPADLRRRGDQRRRQRTLRVQATALAAVAAAVVLAVLYLPGDPTGHPTGPSAGTSSTTTSASPPPISTTTTTLPTSAGPDRCRPATRGLSDQLRRDAQHDAPAARNDECLCPALPGASTGGLQRSARGDEARGAGGVVLYWRSSAPTGSGGVSAYPQGQTVLAVTWPLRRPEVGVVGSQSSACVGCTEGQACPLFASAAADYQTNYQQTCTRPPGESVTPINADIVSFLDPPGVAGDEPPPRERVPIRPMRS